MSMKISGDEIVRSLYKSALSCADHHDADFLKSMHINTPLDDVLLMAIRQKKIAIITGNPGDGKTHLIRKMQENDIPAKVIVNMDANQLDDEDLIKMLDKAHHNKNGLVLAINEGVLLSVCEQAKERSVWAKR